MRFVNWSGALKLSILVLLAEVTGCLADPTTGAVGARRLQPISGTYVLETDGDAVLADTLLALRIARLPDNTGDTIVGAWDRVDTTSLDASSGVLLGTRSGGSIHLEWAFGATQRIFEGVIQDDSIVGVFKVGARAYPAALLPVNLDSSLQRFESLTGWFDPGDRAVIVLRLDDTRDSDRALIGELKSRQLKADFAVITQRVGTPIFLTWREIAGLQRDGFGLVAHSRLHDPGLMDLGRYAWETVGAKNDLMAHGFDVRWFAIVGSWTGESYLDSVSKVHRARGRLLRQYFEGTLAWVYTVPQTVPVPESLAYGLSHINCDHFVVRDVMANIRIAIQRRGYLELSYHSYLADKSLLLPVWDSLALLRDQGLIVITSSAVGSHAAHDGAPALLAAGGGSLGSRTIALSEDVPGACRETTGTLDSAAIALGRGCTLRAELRRPPRGTAVALEATWSGDAGKDTLVLSLKDVMDGRRSTSRSCVARPSASYCTVRLGVGPVVGDVVAEAKRIGSGTGRALLTRAAVLIQ